MKTITLQNGCGDCCLQLEQAAETVRLQIFLSGKLTADNVSKMWKCVSKTLISKTIKKIDIDASDLEYADSAGIGLIVKIRQLASDKDIEAPVTGLNETYEQLLKRYEHKLPKPETSIEKPLGLISLIGKATVRILGNTAELISFFGQLIATQFYLLTHPNRFRWKDFFRTIELAGVNAAGIIALLGFLFGLIMSFSSAMPLRQFGVEIYVADLVAIALVRVLGPFITAIILSGRTGASFAAELGTMKVNSEIDALEVMGLDSMLFLALPRITSIMLMTPLLTLLTNIFGLLGCALVIHLMGYPFITFYHHIQDVLDSGDVVVGLVKSLFFGAMIGAVGCMRGMQTKSGAGAVGISTTNAVVTSIVLLIIMEGIFSVLLYALDI